MRGAPRPYREEERLAALREAEILDTAPEAAFDELVALAAQLCGTPISAVSLVDAGRQWFKARVGLAAEETPREVAFCAHAILGDGVFEIPDARADERFRDNPLVVGEPGIRFYGGAPLATPDGHNLGTLCVIDRRPRSLDDEQRAALVTLARAAGAQIELRRRLRHREGLLVEREREAATRRRVEAELEAQRSMMAQVLDGMASGVTATGADGRFEFVNRAYAAMVGRSPDELVGRTPEEVTAPDDHAVLATQRVRRGAGETSTYETRLRRADGGLVPVLITGVPRVRDGRVAGAIASVTDLSERKRIEEALRESEERLRSTLASLQDLVFVLDREGRFTEYYQPSRAELLVPPEAFLGRRVGEIGFPEPVVRDFERVLAELAERDEVRTLDYALDLPSGRRWFSAHISRRRRADGRLAGITVVTRDVTESVRVEEELRESRNRLSVVNAALARAARLKDEFLAAMSHELRTPLHAVIGLSEALRCGAFGPLGPEPSEAVATVEESGRHLLHLINEILDLSKIEAGRLELRLVELYPADVCSASVRLVKEAAHRKRIRLSVSGAADAPRGAADPVRLKQILVNLLGNAVKFTPEGGEVGLDVTLPPGDESIAFTVRDTGIGIGPRDFERLFQPFVQLDSGLSREHGGTGLGLSLVRRLVELHGGGVAVESEPSRGSRFTVTLPWRSRPDGPPGVEEAAGAATTGALPPAPGAAGPLVLLADDGDVSLGTIGSHLVRRGFRLAVARDGEEALERAQRDRPALVIASVQLPVVDGLEITRRLRASKATAGVPVIAVSAIVVPGDRERCLSAGADAYLRKPVGPAELDATIEQLVPR